MKASSIIYPNLFNRLFSVWFRHYRVYTSHLISNGLPPFIEPLLFLVAIGLGLGNHIGIMQGMPYIEFLATGILLTSAMYTSAFECSYGTFIRLEYEKVYDGMLATPITVNDLIIGEIIWAGTKGFFFSFCVLIVVWVMGVLPIGIIALAPILGFFTGLMFAVMSLLITAFVKTINHFNFYFTGVLSPMFFFCGVVFPITDLPSFIQPVSYIFPLTHSVILVRALATGIFEQNMIWSIIYIAVFIPVVGWFSIQALKKRLID